MLGVTCIDLHPSCASSRSMRKCATATSFTVAQLEDQHTFNWTCKEVCLRMSLHTVAVIYLLVLVGFYSM